MASIKDQIADGTKYDGKAFSGCDMQAIIGNKVIGNLQAVTVSITRETLPIYVMGNASLATIVKGKRGISGTLVFSNFDRHSLLLDTFLDERGTAGKGTLYGKSIQDVLNLTAKTNNGATNNPFSELIGGVVASNPAGDLNVAGVIRSGTNLQSRIQEEIRQVWDAVIQQRKLKYVDQIPPFDLVITMVNDTGNAAWCTIQGITLINEGYGFTMDDLTAESAYTYIAREVTPLVPVGAEFKFSN